MKNLIKTILICLCAFTFFSVQGKSCDVNKSAKKPQWKTDTFAVSNLSCELDMAIVEKNLYRLKGVKKVYLITDQVIVEYNTDKVDSEKIISAIENSGTCEDPNEKTHKAILK